jgi:putative lipoprotein
MSAMPLCRLKIIAIFGLVLLTQSCSLSPNPSTLSSAATPSKSTFSRASSTQQPMTFISRGRLVLGSGASTFTPCYSRDQYQLRLSDQNRQAILALNQASYQELYAEISGTLDIPSKTGFNADYRAILLVDNVNYVAPDALEGCRQSSNGTTAKGERNQWSATEDGGHITLMVAQGSNQELAITSAVHKPNEHYYQLNNGSLKLQNGLCHIGHELFGWQSIMATSGDRYQGCAKLSNQDISAAQWAGNYFATSTKNRGFSIQLTLNDNHTAQTEYLYTDEGNSMVETGFWQQLGEDKLQVIMTQHQQQYLLSQRIFSRKGNSITATHEQVGSQSYKIDNGGLTLFREQ